MVTWFHPGRSDLPPTLPPQMEALQGWLFCRRPMGRPDIEPRPRLVPLLWDVAAIDKLEWVNPAGKRDSHCVCYRHLWRLCQLDDQAAH